VSDLRAPHRTSYAAPIYPAIAVAARVEGDVVLDCTIGTDGVVRDVRVLDGPALLHESARAAVRQWRYTPTKLNGQPVSVLLAVKVIFRLHR
jgi:protein TonB